MRFLLNSICSVMFELLIVYPPQADVGNLTMLEIQIGNRRSLMMQESDHLTNIMLPIN